MPQRKRKHADILRKHPTVLIVEDEPQYVDVLRSALQDSGYEVAVAGDGAAGLKAVVERRPSAILLDVLLPIRNGFELLEEIKSFEMTSDIPVIILSNLDHPHEIQRGLTLGAKQYLIKIKVTPNDVIKALENCLTK